MEKERERERDFHPPLTQNIESDLRMMYYQVQETKK